jgi:Fic family protein
MKNFVDIKKIYDKYKPYHESFFENMLIKFNCESNGIEGNSLNYNETKVLIETGFATGGKPLKDYVEALNHKNAIDVMLHFIDFEDKLKKHMILSFNRILLKGTKFESQSGQYRKIAVTIGDKNITTKPYLIEKEMEDLFLWYENTNISLMEKISMFHAKFEKIHPFIDGNGRTGRLILNYELIKEGYPPLILERTDRNIYYDALEVAQADKPNYKLLIDFFQKNLISSMLYVITAHLEDSSIEQELKKLKQDDNIKSSIKRQR